MIPNRGKTLKRAMGGDKLAAPPKQHNHGIPSLSVLSRWQQLIVIIVGCVYGWMAVLTIHGKVTLCRHLIMGFIIILAAAIDLGTYVLPDILTLGGALIALISSGKSFSAAFLGSLIGLGVMFCIAILSSGGMGGGDVKLGLTIGAFVGWPSIISALAISFLLGGAWGSILILAKKRKKTDYIPFGPFLALGTLIASLWGQELIKWYLTAIWGWM
jgi:prepilin signal peptidase PulO-like enzyme (type II secretory pathway)